MVWIPYIIVCLMVVFCIGYAWFIITDAARQADNIHLNSRIRRFLS